MGALRVFSNLSNLADFPSFSRFASAFFQDVFQQVNGNLEFVKNVRAAGPYTLDFVAAAAPLKVTHSLRIVPQGYLLIYQNLPGFIYGVNTAATPWTTSEIYLQAVNAASAPMSVTATIYVI